MATTTVSLRPFSGKIISKSFGALATIGTLIAIALAVTIQLPTATPVAAVAVVGLLGITTWMLLNERYEWSLAILVLYLGLVDGFLKLKTGSSYATLGRDLLLYAIVVGALIRIAVRRERLVLPPLSVWVIAWCVVVIIQIANPSNTTLLHAVGSIRPHLEWVPLFFFGYFAIRSKRRLRGFLMLLVIIASVNGVVGFIQLNLTPEELSNWGPGYEKYIQGEEGGVSARTFVDSEGKARTRPFGLGGDFGFGGAVGVIALPAALALFALYRRPNQRLLLALLSAGTVLAIATSQSRSVVLSAVVVAFAYAGLAVTSRTGLRTVLALGLAAIVAYTTLSLLASDSNSEFRYGSISSPGKALSTSYNYRSSTLANVPKYATDYPFGAGIGTGGPASGFAGGGAKKLDAESEATFLLIETGIPGLIVMLGFNLTLVYVCVTRIRTIADRELRILMTAVAAPLFSMFVSWWVGVTTATSPGSPYLWFAAGIIAFWILGVARRARTVRSNVQMDDAGQAVQPAWSTG